MTLYYRPLAQVGPGQPDDAVPLAGGWAWFTQVEILSRSVPSRVVPAQVLPPRTLAALTAPRAAIGGLGMDRPRVMGILNATPDSFSDGGKHAAAADAVAAGQRMCGDGADILDVGGESTRPGAVTVPAQEETDRVVPVVEGLRDCGALISTDTRKADVARAALDAGAGLINDVSGFTYDPALAGVAAEAGVPVCVMHALGDPATMQNDPRYDNVLLDVYDFLEDRIAALVASGIPRGRIVADPGIGFGKTVEHNLTLLSGLSLFHGLGVPILLGASRKGFIGKLGRAPLAESRAGGSIGVALAGVTQGVQMLRVHDVRDTVQAITLWRAAISGRQDD
ncbi:Dihydropteroate synthase [Sulfitobacter sp. THAF37]|uniref:dihydropteroate synthase n=1 Tax=Sulfitobacter sp. THAF37 TaxID=2587855 RepID=UPI0012679993|nr:dihydropteroate synthase [Sulfitobacter sp. THAF37]QFT60409.1 Dihydropteroate synthase [Sulfitobacter sp. THAF37]